MGLENMQALYLHELKDIHSAEKQILEALPKMAKATNHEELRRAFSEHEKVTEEHVRRLESIFDDLGEKPGSDKCKGMEGLIEEGEEILKEDADPDVRDAALIAAAQRVEHYEIAAYGTARTYARQLGFDKHANLLQQTLDEEGATDRKLTKLAESGINRDAEVGR
ncbi:MAG TPA: ferritin-like domain-containing protein [Longimicrobiales bacterium]|nr:ferritin-like domain-containing protein [Longimicrobiales bacterium]